MRIPHRPHSLFALLMMVSLPLSARTTSEWELSVGGGWSTFTYAVRSPFESLRVSQAGSWAATGHGAYTCMFTDYIGLGVALDMTRYGASINADGWVQ